MDNPDEGESILAELASKGVIDDISLAVATADSTERFETIDIMEGAGPYKAPKKYFHLTNSVDRHQINDDFVISLALTHPYRGGNNRKLLIWSVDLNGNVAIARREPGYSGNLKHRLRGTCKPSKKRIETLRTAH